MYLVAAVLVAGAVVLVSIGVVKILPLGRSQREEMRRSLHELAGELGASVRKAPHETIVDLVVGGQPAAIAWGFVKWGRRRMFRDALRLELSLPAPLPRFRVFDPRAPGKFLTRRFPGEQRLALPKQLAVEIRAVAPEPERVAARIPPSVFEIAFQLLHRGHLAELHDPTGWELRCEGTHVAGVVPNRWDMDKVRAALGLLSLLVECSRAAAVPPPAGRTS